MANKLFTLFEDKLRTPQDLVASQPQNLQSIGQEVEDPQAILRMIQQFEVVRPKADYSDFSNFVFFNSALDYFNITGEKVLNEYPYDRSSPDVQDYLSSLDEYQRYVASVWPSNTGHLRFDPSQGFAKVSVLNVGSQSGSTSTGILNVGTGSFTVEFWAVPPPALTGSNDAMIAVQNSDPAGNGVTVAYSGSRLVFETLSGSNKDVAVVPVNAGVPTYFACVFDTSNSPSILRVFTGSAVSFPVLAGFATSSITGIMPSGSQIYFGSGSSPGPTFTVRPLTGSLDDIRFWNVALGISQLTSSFNSRISAQDDLVGLWRFNETGSLPIGEREIALDASGHKLNGRISNYYTSIRGSGSLIPFDEPDLVLSMGEPAVATYIATQQLSGTIYDRFNDNIITRLMPEQFFLLEEFKNTTVLQDFLFVLARYFDNLKVMIDQFAYIRRASYQDINTTPDALLQDIGKFFGWEFTGAFLNNDAIQYILGKNVLSNLNTNQSLDTKLFEIKNEFWKRTLVNLMHLYKTKGTRQSVESLLRIYGANSNFIRVKEYGYKPNSGIQTARIASEKSVNVVAFGSGTAHNTSIVTPAVGISPHLTSSGLTTEVRVAFPTTTSTEMNPTVATGTLWTLLAPNFTGSLSGSYWQRLSYAKNSVSSTTGSLKYQHWTLDQNGNHVEYDVSLTNLPIFDESWVNVAVYRTPASGSGLGSLTIDVRRLDNDTVTYAVTGTLTGTNVLTSSLDVQVQLGSISAFGTGSEFWGQEFRVWSEVLGNTELQDHTLNFQSYGTETEPEVATLDLHWRLNDNLADDGSGNSIGAYYDYSGHGMMGSGSGFVANDNPNKKYLFDYNFIAAPEYGWTEQKIRSFDSSFVKPEDAFQDNPMVGLEFNLIDALNEDISQIVSSLDSFNNYIGSPVNTYRESYHDLGALRRDYFKKLSGKINFRVFADLLEFFDRSFVDLVRRLIPARATFLGDEFVVESHMLERPKVQWNYRRRDEDFTIDGSIQIYVRT